MFVTIAKRKVQGCSAYLMKSAVVHRAILSTIVVVSVALILSGCSTGRLTPVSGGNGLAPDSPSGAVRARAMVDSSELDGHTVRITYVRGGMVVKQEAVVTNGQISVESPRLFVGDWQIDLRVVDESGRALYSGRTEVTVTKDTTTNAEVTLGPADGILSVTLDLSEFMEVDGVLKGRLLTNDEDRYQNFEIPDPNQLVEVTMELAPRQYDIAVALYKDAYYSYKRIYLSPYQALAIESGKTTSVSWKPQLGLIDFEVDVRDQPSPPSDLAVTNDGTWAKLTWTQSFSGDAAGYRIYSRTDDQFMGYGILAEVPGNLTEYFLDLTQFPTATVVHFVVTAVNSLGSESQRSNQVSLPLQG